MAEKIYALASVLVHRNLLSGHRMEMELLGLRLEDPPPLLPHPYPPVPQNHLFAQSKLKKSLFLKVSLRSFLHNLCPLPEILFC